MLQTRVSTSLEPKWPRKDGGDGDDDGDSNGGDGNGDDGDSNGSSDGDDDDDDGPGVFFLKKDVCHSSTVLT